MESDSSYTNLIPPPPPSSSSLFQVPIKVEFPSTTFLEPEEEETVPVSEGAKQGAMEAPRPLDCLHETPIPPFLLKTYDIVDDHSMDSVISWGPGGNSFVVWDPHLFERAVLPRNFKHGNFSSFVRQLNTYGFRKISADRWEFANEYFLRGNKQLLKGINRRRSHGGAQAGSSLAVIRPGLDSELQNLKRDKNALLEEVLRLQQDQLSTINQMSMLDQKLQTTEERQKQMVSFLAKILRNPNMLAQFRINQEQRHKRKFLKHQKQGRSSSLVQPPDAFWNDAAVQSEQANEPMRVPSYLEAASLSEDGFPEVGLPEVDLHSRSIAGEPGTKGKGIMGEQLHIESDMEQNIMNTKPFPDINTIGEPNLLELPDAFYDLDLDLDLDLGPMDKTTNDLVPPAVNPY